LEQQAFINKVKDKAIELQTTHNILASITIAQAILESGWGTSILYQNANSSFGIKWTDGCGYDKYLVDTKEIENGEEITIQAYFRKYNCLEDSIKDHATFLQKDRYKNLIGNSDYTSVANNLYADGYSTSPEYPGKLIKLIEQYGLNQYDNLNGINNNEKGSNKMKIGLRAGHSDNCTGAIGIVDEHEQMKIYCKAVKAVFEEYGHTVVDCNSNGSNASAELSEGAAASNNASCDLFISLHMNCYNGEAHGTETLVSSTSSGAYQYATNLVNNFAEMGFTNRGVKCESLYEMNHINAPNIISEICFCDNAEDIAIYNQYSWEQLAHILCNAIDSNIPKEVESSTATTTDTTKGYVVTNYLPHSSDSYDGVDISYVLSYFDGVKCYVRGNGKGVWIETEYLSLDKCNSLKEILGSWFYLIEK
jgi:N-acetylmuramoyl-L-alanine amidase